MLAIAVPARATSSLSVTITASGLGFGTNTVTSSDTFSGYTFAGVNYTDTGQAFAISRKSHEKPQSP